MANRLTCELRVTFKRQLPLLLAESLGAHFNGSADVSACIAKTSLSNIEGYKKHAKFALDLMGRVSIFVVEDANTIVIYTEKSDEFDIHLYAQEVADLKKHTNLRIEAMRRYAKSSRNQISSAQASISYGQNPIFTTKEAPFSARLRDKVKTNIPARMSVPIASAIAGYALTQKPEDIAKATITGIAAAVVSVVVEAFFAERIKYENAP